MCCPLELATTCNTISIAPPHIHTASFTSGKVAHGSPSSTGKTANPTPEWPQFQHCLARCLCNHRIPIREHSPGNTHQRVKYRNESIEKLISKDGNEYLGDKTVSLTLTAPPGPPASAPAPLLPKQYSSQSSNAAPAPKN